MSQFEKALRSMGWFTLIMLCAVGCGRPQNTTVRSGTTSQDAKNSENTDSVGGENDPHSIAPMAIQNSSSAQAQTATDYAQFLNSAPKRTLVLYNRNDPESFEIARYYLEKRGLKEQQLCSVALPLGVFASKDQFLEAHSEILSKCICPMIQQVNRPATCSFNNIDAVAANAPVSHLVLIRGLPHRLYGTGWTSDREGPSLDFYLGALLYRDSPRYFGSGTTGKISDLYVQDNRPERPMPNRPEITRMAVVGRIDGLTASLAKATINRTINQELKGFEGNVYIQNSESNQSLKGNTLLPVAAMQSTNSFDTNCLKYGSVQGPWPLQTCRTLFTADQRFPGETSLVPFAGLYLGGNFSLVGQSAFNGKISTALNWRKSLFPGCKAICKDEVDPVECRSRSIDPFKIINTGCVGFAPGFMGSQIRSIPVKFFGVVPKGWTMSRAELIPVTPPVVMEGDAWLDQRTTDKQFLRFGRKTSRQQICKDPDSSSKGCDERLSFMLETRFPAKGVVGPAGKYQYELRYRVRNAKSSFPNGTMNLFTQGVTKSGNIVGLPGTKSISTSVARDQWETNVVRLEFDRAYPPPDFFEMRFFSYLEHGTTGYLDLDGIEFVDLNAPGSPDIMPFGVGTFRLPFDGNPDYGDYPAWVIDRMGGIGWWGSGSHHLTSGYAFLSQGNILLNMFGGVTAGEAVWLGTNGESGTTYIDPLYRPGAAALYLEGPKATKSILQTDMANTKEFEFYANYGEDSRVKINAAMGTGSNSRVEWIVDLCERPRFKRCNASSDPWRKIASGNTAVYGHDIGSLLSIVTNPNVSAAFDLRIRVWNPAGRKQLLSSTGIFFYQASKIPIVTLDPEIYKNGTPFDRANNTIVLTPVVDGRYPNVYKQNLNFLEFTVDSIRDFSLEQWELEVQTNNHGTWKVNAAKTDKPSNVVTFDIGPKLTQPDIVTLKLSVLDQPAFTSAYIYLPGNVYSPGGATRDSEVDDQDVEMIENAFNRLPVNSRMRLVFDINADGILDQVDVDLVRAWAAESSFVLPK